ncbi:TPA: hypothetical protein ACHWJ6_000808 [Streptococcus suis]
MLRGRKFKRETTHHGTLNTLVTFKRMTVADDFYDSNEEAGEVFKVWAEVRNVSVEDLDSLKGRFSKNALALESIKSKAIKGFATIKFRDPVKAFLPKNSDIVEIHDPMYSDKTWEVAEVKINFYNRKFQEVILVGS